MLISTPVCRVNTLGQESPGCHDLSILRPKTERATFLHSKVVGVTR